MKEETIKITVSRSSTPIGYAHGLDITLKSPSNDKECTVDISKIGNGRHDNYPLSIKVPSNFKMDGIGYQIQFTKYYTENLKEELVKNYEFSIIVL